MAYEQILLRGGPLPDRYIEWGGGDEVEVDYITEYSDLPSPPAVSEMSISSALYRRSKDDQKRFDFIELL